MDTNTKVGDVSEPRCLPACLRNPCMSLEVRVFISTKFGLNKKFKINTKK